MSPDTLALILTFLTAQIGALLAFFKWKEELRRDVEKTATTSAQSRAEIKQLMISLLAELGYSHLAAPDGKDRRSLPRNNDQPH